MYLCDTNFHFKTPPIGLQHWMCSVCRRRVTKPAIPAEALKELGLNQNSSPVRRMVSHWTSFVHTPSSDAR